MSSLGEALRNAREARGLTLSDAAEHIHIRSVYLAAIEAEDWSAIGAPVYARGFVRAYARFLGLDPEEAVARFAERVPSESPSHVSASMASLGASPQRGAPSLVAIVGILVAVALVAFVGYEYYTYRAGTAAAPAAGSAGVPRAVDAAPSSSPEQVAAATPDAPAADGDPSPAADASPPPDAAPGAQEPSPAPMAKDELQIRLAARSWVRVVIDGKTTLEGIFPAGTTRTFSGKTAQIRAGNAAGVEVIVAGRSQGAMGAPGDVVERAYTLSQPE